MLPDFGWTELLLIAIVLIVVVGPKDLPRVLRGFSKTLGSARKMAGDFRKQFDDALSDAEMDEFKNIANDVRSLNPRSKIKEVLNPLSDMGRDISNELKGVAKSVDDAAKADDTDGEDAVNAQVKREYTPDEHYPQLAAKRKEREAAEKTKTEETSAKKPAAKKRAPAKKAAAKASAKSKTTAAKKPTAPAKSASASAKTAVTGTSAKAPKAAPAKAVPAKKPAARKAAPRKAATPKGEA